MDQLALRQTDLMHMANFMKGSTALNFTNFCSAGVLIV